MSRRELHKDAALAVAYAFVVAAVMVAAWHAGVLQGTRGRAPQSCAVEVDALGRCSARCGP